MILRCTGKLLSLLGARPTSLPAQEPSDDDWYANLLWLERRKCLLLVHAGTLFPVFVADVGQAGLMPVGGAIVGLIEHELLNEDLPLETFGELDPGSVNLAKTASRVLLGYMNEMARYCEYTVFGEGGFERCVRCSRRMPRRSLDSRSSGGRDYLAAGDTFVSTGPDQLVRRRSPATATVRRHVLQLAKTGQVHRQLGAAQPVWSRILLARQPHLVVGKSPLLTAPAHQLIQQHQQPARLRRRQHQVAMSG